jgi:drug/metabolite transporter (DMT)-like permease
MISKEKKMSVVPIILTAVFLAVIGQIFVKRGLDLLGTIDFSSGLFITYVKIFFSPFVLIGTVFYTISIFFWIYSLTRVDLSFAFPFLSLSYVLIILASWLMLGENIPLLRWIGVLVICLGVFLVSRS